RILCGLHDGIVRSWNALTGEQKQFGVHAASLHALAMSVDGGQCAVCTLWPGDNTFGLYDLETGRIIRSFTGHENWVTGVALSPDGRLALSGDRAAGTAHLWDVDTGKDLQRLEGHGEDVCSVAFAPDSRRAIAGDRAGFVRVWDLRTGKESGSFRVAGG